MSHHHDHHTHSHGAAENIAMAFWLNTAFALLELAGGFYTNSVAILSDSLHDFGDSLSLGFSFYFQKKSAQLRDGHFTYGYKRFSLIGAIINAIILSVGSVFIIAESVKRFFSPVTPDAKGMLILAIIGVAVNVLAMLRLKKGHSLNEKVVSLHFLEDVLGWIAVLVGSVVMMFADVPWLDSLLSLFIAGFILFNVFRNMKETFYIILQGIPGNVNEKHIKEEILKVSGIATIHDLHIWTMDGEYNVLTAHLVAPEVSTLTEAEQLKERIKHLLHHQNIQHATIEIENGDNKCSLENC